MAERLTKRALDALRRWAQEHPAKQREVGDTEIPGLYARARRGRVEFFYRAGKGRRSRRRVGQYGPMTLDEARASARELYTLVRRGVDLAADRREAALRSRPLEQAVEAYLDDLAERAEKGARRGRRSSHALFERLLRKHVLPHVGAMPIADLDVDKVRGLHRRLHETPVEANRMLTALSAVLAFAELRGLRPPDSNPCRHVERFEETGERRALTPPELERLGEAMQQAEAEGRVHPSALLALRLIALTGLRRSEVLGHESKKRRGDLEGLRWGDVDLDAGVIRLRQTKTGTQTRVVGQVVLELLKQAKPEEAGQEDPVCQGVRPGQPFVGIDRPRAKIFEAAGLAGLPGVDMHSLRHTFASIGAHVQNGRWAAFVGPLLGHGYQRRSITERYIHSDLEALRPAADAIAGTIAASLGLTERGRVLAFKPAEGAPKESQS